MYLCTRFRSKIEAATVCEHFYPLQENEVSDKYMSKKRVLFVTQEMEPYSLASDISTLVRRLTQYTNDKGFEIRILMPRFGTINERRHRLHEVVRLSGMNIIVDDEDYPLIIKVASLPGARIQVYFLDNDEFFKRKMIFLDGDDKPFEDNTERTVFFCKGVIETVKKFGWAPDIVHCNGWMASMVPAYLRTVYLKDPIFSNSKIVYSPYQLDVDAGLTEDFVETAAINNMESDLLAPYLTDGKLALNAGAMHFADAVYVGSKELDDVTTAAVQTAKDAEKSVLDYVEIEEAPASILEWYMSLLPADETEEEEA
jgi:starch synthase